MDILKQAEKILKQYQGQEIYFFYPVKILKADVEDIVYENEEERKFFYKGFFQAVEIYGGRKLILIKVIMKAKNRDLFSFEFSSEFILGKNATEAFKKYENINPSKMKNILGF